MKPHERGAFIMLDPEPDPHGIYVIDDGRARLHEPGDELPRYMPHQVTCEAEGVPRRSPLAKQETRP
jgi:hypothetical protein